MPPNKEERLPASIRDELRRLVGLKCLDVLFRRDSMKVSEQWDLMFDLFHGNQNTGTISNVSLLVGAEEAFEDLFEYSNHPVVNRNSTADSPVKQLKYRFCRRLQPMVLEKQITVEILSRANYRNKSLLLGRTLYNNAKDVLTTVRKACAFAARLVDEDGVPVESGKTQDDVIEEMLSDMYRLLKGKKSSEVEEDEDPTSESEELPTGSNDDSVVDKNGDDDRPASWFFHGFMAVLLFGPLAPKEQRLSFFFSSDPLPADKKSFGRAAARAERKKTEDKERSLNVVAGSKNARGMSVSERVKLAKLEIQVGRYNKDLLDSNVLTLRVEASLLESKLERAMKRAATTSNFDQVDQLEAELDEVRAAIVALRTQQNKNKHGVKRCHDLLTANDEQAQEADEADAQSISTRTTSDLTNANSTN